MSRINFKDLAKNWGLATADATLSTFGATDVIKNNQYVGGSADKWAMAGNISGAISKTALPLAMNAALPGSGQFVSMGQGLVGQTTNQNSNMFPMGGMNMQPNAEVEKQENTLNPDGSSTQFDGPTHENGGIPTNLDPGTLIFSDKLKHMGKTFAELNKANNTNREDKILNDPSANKDVKDVALAAKNKKIQNSVSLFKIQEELKASKLDKYQKRLGGIMQYPNGGITPTQYKQAQQDSLTLYNAGLKSNKIPVYQQPGAMEAADRLNIINGTAINPIKGQFYSNQPDYTGGYNVQFQKPTMVPYKGATEITPTDGNIPAKVIYHPNYQQPIDGIKKSYYRNGGVLPKYADGDITPITPSLFPQGESTYSLGIPYSNEMSMRGYGQGIYDPQDLQLKGNPQIQDVPTNIPTAKVPTSTGINKDALYQAGFGLAQNLGQMAYLKEQGKKYDTQKFYNYTPTLLNSKQALLDAKAQTKVSRQAVKDASGGNAASMLANTAGLNSKYVQDVARIRQTYDNANAGIINQGSQYNIQNQYMTDDINARNKGQALTNYYSTLGSVGTNTAQGMKDNRALNMDKEAIGMLPKMFDNPAYAKYIDEYLSSKGYKKSV